MDEDRRRPMAIEGEASKRYRLSYGGQLIGSYDTAKEALERYDKHNDLIRPVIDRKKKWSYSIIDGQTEITSIQLRRAAEAEA